MVLQRTVEKDLWLPLLAIPSSFPSQDSQKLIGKFHEVSMSRLWQKTNKQTNPKDPNQFHLTGQTTSSRSVVIRIKLYSCSWDADNTPCWFCWCLGSKEKSQFHSITMHVRRNNHWGYQRKTYEALCIYVCVTADIKCSLTAMTI